MRRVVRCCAVLAVGCGRLAFDPAGFDDDDISDGAVGDGATGNGTCPSFAVFCDGFESGDLSKWTFTHYSGPNPTALAVTTPTHGGAFVLASNVPPGGQDAAASPVLAIPAQSTGTLAVRQWIYATQAIRNFNVVQVLQNDQTGQFTTVGGDEAGRWVSSDNTASNVLLDHRSAVMTAPLATWTCVEMVFTFPQNASPARIQLFVNETSVLDVDS